MPRRCRTALGQALKNAFIWSVGTSLCNPMKKMSYFQTFADFELTYEGGEKALTFRFCRKRFSIHVWIDRPRPFFQGTYQNDMGGVSDMSVAQENRVLGKMYENRDVLCDAIKEMFLTEPVDPDEDEFEEDDINTLIRRFTVSKLRA